MDAAATRSDASLFAVAFAAAVAAACGVAALVPLPGPPAFRLPEVMRPADPAAPADRALQRALASRTDDPAALRRLAEQLRSAHRPLELAILLERLHAATGEAEPLREAMALRTELGDFAAARAALLRLSGISATTAAEEVQLAQQRQEAGDEMGAAVGLTAALARLPGPEIALRATQAAARLADPAPVLRQLAIRLADYAPELLEPLRRVLMEDARPDLALALIEGLPPAELQNPPTVFRHAEAEARAGFPGFALSRLLALRATEGLPPGAGALLVDLALREGRMDQAFDVAAQLPADAWPGDLAMRLHLAARLANQPELMRRLDPARLAARPEVAALVALARGDRAGAGRFARTALDRPPASAEGARTLAQVLRDLGQDSAAWDRLRGEMTRGRPEPSAIRLFAELSALPGRGATALPILERLRGGSATAGEAWLRLALQEGRRAEAAAFLRDGGVVPARALTETLTMAAAGRDAPLADAAALRLRGRTDLPETWTPEEVGVTASLARPLTAGTLTAALDLLGWATEAEARQRVTLLLAAAPEVAAATTPDTARHPSIARLRREAETADGEGAIARIALLAVLSPAQAVPLLARRAEQQPGRFGGALVLARLRAEGVAAGEAELRGLLPRLNRQQQEGALFLLLAAAPAEGQASLRRLASATLGNDWQRGYEATLARQGRRAELLAALRARAAAAETTPAERRAIADRLRELGDRDGAEAILR
jgi:hypothetical protein